LFRSPGSRGGNPGLLVLTASRFLIRPAEVSDKGVMATRIHCTSAGVCLLIALVVLVTPVAAQRTGFDVGAIDRDRILKAAHQYLSETPITITASHSPRSAGGVHDFFSEGDYWWPDPQNPGGPYIQRDGRSNPDNFDDHRRALDALQCAGACAGSRVVADKRRAVREARRAPPACVVSRLRDADEIPICNTRRQSMGASPDAASASSIRFIWSKSRGQLRYSKERRRCRLPNLAESGSVH